MILDVKNLSKEFKQGTSLIPAVQNISFSMKAGETLSIVGPSGSGKTTLLSLLSGLEQPTQGSIDIQGQRITSMTEKELSTFRSQNIGIVFQQFHLMPHLTAEENISLPLEISGQREVQKKVHQVLEEVDLIDRKTHLPHQLSGGENQRVAIARAIVIQPKILFADEPSGNLDTNTGMKVVDLLFSLVQSHSMTMILVTHNESLSVRCGQQMRMTGGQAQ